MIEDKEKQENIKQNEHFQRLEARRKINERLVKLEKKMKWGEIMKFTVFGKIMIGAGLILVLHGTQHLPLPEYYGAVTVLGAVIAIYGAFLGHKHE